MTSTIRRSVRAAYRLARYARLAHASHVLSRRFEPHVAETVRGSTSSRGGAVSTEGRAASTFALAAAGDQHRDREDSPERGTTSVPVKLSGPANEARSVASSHSMTTNVAATGVMASQNRRPPARVRETRPPRSILTQCRRRRGDPFTNLVGGAQGHMHRAQSHREDHDPETVEGNGGGGERCPFPP